MEESLQRLAKEEEFCLTKMSVSKLWKLYYLTFLTYFLLFFLTFLSLHWDSTDTEMSWRNKALPEADLVNWSLRLFQLKNPCSIKVQLHLIILICISIKKYFESWGINVLQLSKKTNQFLFSLLKLVVALLAHRSFCTEAQTYQCIEGSDGEVLLIISELNAFVGTSFKSPENATTSF